MYTVFQIWIQIFDSGKLNQLSKFHVQSDITQLEFSPDDAFIFAVTPKKQSIHFRCLTPEGVIEGNREGWTAKIEDSLAGISGVVWAPDSRQVLVYSDLLLRVTIWSLVEQNPVSHIRCPKSLPPKGYSFSSNGKFMAFAERRDLKDWVSIYYCGHDWKMVNTFEVETFDMADLMWIKSDSCILVWDTPLENRVLLYSAMTGQVLSKHLGSSPQYNLGIKSVSLAPSGLLLLHAFFDTKLKVLNCLTQKEVVQLDHVAVIQKGEPMYEKLAVYREEQLKERNFGVGQEMAPQFHYQLVLNQRNKENERATGETFKLPTAQKKDIQAFQTSQFEKVGLQGPPTGISLISWSHDSCYLATKCDQLPLVVWVWDMRALQLIALLIHQNPVKGLAFSPKNAILSVCTGQGRICMWSPLGASVCEIPQHDVLNVSTNGVGMGFQAQKVRWNAKGTIMMILDKSNLIMAFPSPDYLSVNVQSLKATAEGKQKEMLQTINSQNEEIDLDASAKKIIMGGGGLNY